jgi:hypothetical protein
MRVFLIEATVAGTLGALAMMPAGFFFRALQMRVGHYGPKFAELYLSSPGPLALFMQHIVLGWVSAVPLAFLSLNKYSVRTAFLIGASYGQFAARCHRVKVALRLMGLSVERLRVPPGWQ